MRQNKCGKLALALILWAVSFLCSATAYSANLIVNPGVEEINDKGLPVKWSQYYGSVPAVMGVATKSEGEKSENVFAGLRSASYQVLQFGNDGYAACGLVAGDTNGYDGSNAYPVEPGTKYYYSFWIKGTGFTRSITVSPWGWAASGASGTRVRNIGGLSIYITDTWTKYSGSFTVPSNVNKVALVFYIYGLMGRDLMPGAIYYVDEVYLSTEAEKTKGADALLNL